MSTHLEHYQLTEGNSSIWQTLLDQALPLTETELAQLRFITQKLRDIPTQTINEATIWARAIYQERRVREPLKPCSFTPGMKNRVPAPMSVGRV